MKKQIVKNLIDSLQQTTKLKKNPNGEHPDQEDLAIIAEKYEIFMAHEFADQKDENGYKGLYHSGAKRFTTINTLECIFDKIAKQHSNINLTISSCLQDKVFLPTAPGILFLIALVDFLLIHQSDVSLVMKNEEDQVRVELLVSIDPDVHERKNDSVTKQIKNLIRENRIFKFELKEKSRKQKEQIEDLLNSCHSHPLYTLVDHYFANNQLTLFWTSDKSGMKRCLKGNNKKILIQDDSSKNRLANIRLKDIEKKAVENGFETLNSEHISQVDIAVIHGNEKLLQLLNKKPVMADKEQIIVFISSAAYHWRENHRVLQHSKKQYILFVRKQFTEKIFEQILSMKIVDAQKVLDGLGPDFFHFPKLEYLPILAILGQAYIFKKMQEVNSCKVVSKVAKTIGVSKKLTKEIQCPTTMLETLKEWKESLQTQSKKECEIRGEVKKEMKGDITKNISSLIACLYKDQLPENFSQIVAKATCDIHTFFRKKCV